MSIYIDKLVYQSNIWNNNNLVRKSNMSSLIVFN